MKVNDTVLILAAGFGTRMGEIGKTLPKPLWPIAQTTLLAKQIQFARSISNGDIWVNVHHCKELMCDYLQRFFPSVKIIVEDEILGSGGAIHNLMKYAGVTNNLITINSDVLYSLSEFDIQKFLRPMDSTRARLVSMPVDANQSYNALITQNNILIEISKPLNTSYRTYCGLGRIQLDGLKIVDGVSPFFETVAPFKSEIVEIEDLPSLKMKDYGTLEEYCGQFFKDAMKKVHITSELGSLTLERQDQAIIANYKSY